MFNQSMKGNRMMPSLLTKPYALYCDEELSLRSLTARVSILATSEQTGGVFNLFDVFCPPDYVTSLHIHYMEDVAIYVLEGTLTIFWGSEKNSASAGSYLYQPRGTPHGFRVEGASPARILYFSLPAGLDRLINELGQLTLDCESAIAAARYKIEILGPLPE
jgi:quercetin dioxygenase-like cupin family protein